MAALKEVRLRMRAVSGIRQITKAMKMVATFKMRRVQGKLVKVRSFTDSLYEVAVRLAASRAGEETTNPFLAGGGGGEEAVVVVSSDRGLCGSFNMNLFRVVAQEYAGRHPAYILLGRKARSYFSRQDVNIVKTYEKLSFPVEWPDAERISREMLEMYRASRYSKVTLAYQRFISTGRSSPRLASWLPFRQGGDDGPRHLSCEPSVPGVLDAVLPKALTAQLYRAILEAQTSEQSARMVAMENATNNANDLIRDLNLLGNKLRQNAITKELLEISTGAEVLKVS